uniref:Uncharacterized protein n=1 Tax=Anopheles coluzzii TaxID=1518534 RepID=A0A8W7PA22_ANOCL
MLHLERHLHNPRKLAKVYQSDQIAFPNLPQTAKGVEPDGDAHRHLEDVILERGVVRAALQYDFALALHPVVDGVRLGLAVALEGNPAAQLGVVLARRQPHNRLD